MVKYYKELMLSKPARTLKEVIQKLIPSKGIKRRANVEGSKLLECEGKEIPLQISSKRALMLKK